MLDDNQGIACTRLPPDGDGPVAYKVDGATDYYVNNPYEPDSDYSFVMSGGHARMTGLSGHFVEHGITFAELTEWKFDGLELRTPEGQGKRRRADDDNGFAPSAASSDNTLKKRPRGPRRRPRPCSTASRRQLMRRERLSILSLARGRQCRRCQRCSGG